MAARILIRLPQRAQESASTKNDRASYCTLPSGCVGQDTSTLSQCSAGSGPQRYRFRLVFDGVEEPGGPNSLALALATQPASPDPVENGLETDSQPHGHL